MATYITFDGVAYKDRMLLWEIGKDKTATLTFLTENGDTFSYPNKVIQSLKEFEAYGMVFESDSVTIPNYKVFGSMFTMQTLNVEESKEKDSTTTEEGKIKHSPSKS